MVKTLFAKIIVPALLVAVLSASISALPLFHGTVTDQSGQPVFGASVAVVIDGSVVTGKSTDANGLFQIPVQLASDIHTYLRITAIGYDSAIIPITPIPNTDGYIITLQEKEVELKSITVVPQESRDALTQSITHHRLRQDARESLVSTNPLTSLKEPQISRRGSAHSSTLRINGTSPQYFINGSSMGADPNHYGLFSILPLSVVDNVQFYPQGTSAKYGLPSVVELKTPTPFDQGIGGDLYLSLLEATGSYRYGSDRFFALGSIRQSIVDQFAETFNSTKEGDKIPPTKFRDIFVSGGYKVNSTRSLFVDGYDVTDNLKYERAPNDGDPGIETYVATSRQYIGVRDEMMLNGSLSVKSAVSYTQSDERYSVNGWQNEPSKVIGDLKEKSKTINANSAAELVYADRKFQIGFEAEMIFDRMTDLKQQNWNFLPPDANTDNPFIYTPELNMLYGTYHHTADAQNYAGYFSLSQQFGKLTLESGVRVHTFSELGDPSAVALRQRFAVAVTKQTTAELFLGTFAENPITRVLEPYQVLTRASAEYLEPVNTYLASFHLSHRFVRGTIFVKEIDRYPTLTPDFNKINHDDPVPVPEPGFLTMRSNGTMAFTGADISFDLKNIIHNKLDIYTYYGFTHAIKQTHGIEAPYDLSSPHRFMLDAKWRFSNRFTVGSSLQIRSGYPYSPDHSNYILLPSNTEDRYTESYYQNYLRSENTREFPINAALNVHCSVDFGNSALYASVSNVTNRANPVIFTGRKYIYDLGIFPSIGFSTEF